METDKFKKVGEKETKSSVIKDMRLKSTLCYHLRPIRANKHYLEDER